jgi:Protein of unknown function (DUF2442)
MASNHDFELAGERAQRLKEEFPRAVSAYYEPSSGNIVVQLSSRLNLSFSPRDAQGLRQAKPSELEEIEISPSGFGLHFPKLDADLYLPGLLQGFLGSKRWMASQLGQIGGQSRSRAKKASSRANGKLGGRPRKAARG